MTEKIPIRYAEFYDFPRQIDFQFEGEWFFLRSSFDDERDDYSEVYNVYLLPFHSEEELKANPYFWVNLKDAAHLGQIPIAEVGLDNTRRQTIDANVFKQWLSTHRN